MSSVVKLSRCRLVSASERFVNASESFVNVCERFVVFAEDQPCECPGN